MVKAKTTGELIREAIKRLGLGQRQVGNLAGVSERTMMRYVNNNTPVTPAMAVALMKAGVVPTSIEMRALSPRNAAEFWAMHSARDQVAAAQPPRVGLASLFEDEDST